MREIQEQVIEEKRQLKQQQTQQFSTRNAVHFQKDEISQAMEALDFQLKKMKKEADGLHTKRAQAEKELQAIQTRVHNAPINNMEAYENQLKTALLRNSYNFVDRSQL